MISGFNNKLAIGIVEGSSTTNLINFLSHKNVPSATYYFEFEKPSERLADIRDRIRSVVAGLQIDRPIFGTVVSKSTLRFNAELADGTRGFVTANHCTRIQAELEGSNFKQPAVNISGGNNHIGEEVSDPEADLNVPSCPSGAQCRWSDSAFVEYSSGASSSLGKIARIGSWGAIGPISTSDPDYDIASAPIFALVGEVVINIGRTTGKTAGVITNSCVNNSPDHLTSLCQVLVRPDPNIGGGITPLTKKGDSGGPVFRILSGTNPNHNVLLYGITTSSYEVDSFIYSPTLNTLADLTPEVGSIFIN